MLNFMLTTFNAVAPEDVRDVRELMAAVCSTDSVTEMDMREILYRIAALFLHMERSYRFPYRLRYQVHHALYLSENAWNYDASSSPAGNSDSGPSLNFTAEQKRIIGYPLDPTNNGVVRVLAYAGTGKTTVLKQLALENPSLKFLLIAFNKSTQRCHVGKDNFNVEPRTAHSIAYKWCIRNGYVKERLSLKSTYVSDVLAWGKLRRDRGPGFGNIIIRTALTLEALRNFAHSTRPHVLPDDVPEEWHSEDGGTEKVKPLVRHAAWEDAQILWDQGIAKKESKFKIEGTFWIKLCQLRNPNLHHLENRGPFDVILIDEGQDMNPAMLHICLRQKGLKMIVGDPNQQIYEWNGAINGLEEVESYCRLIDTLALTESFRFGTEIAFVATAVMNCLLPTKKPQHMLSSDRTRDTLSFRGNPEAGPTKKMAILSRSNERMWTEIFAVVCESKVPLKIKINGFCKRADLHKYLGDLCDLSLLKQNEKDKIPSTSKYKREASFEEYKCTQKMHNNSQELMKCTIAGRYTAGKMAQYCEIIRRSAVFNSWDVDYVFSTAHQFKGLEYPTVMLLDDFLFDRNPYYGRKNYSEDMRNPEEEKRILYVALTRAKSELILNDTLVMLLWGSGRMNFERVTEVNGDMIGKCCGHPKCDRALTADDPLAVVYNSLAERYFCCICSGNPYKRSLKDFTCRFGMHYINMDNEWARLRQSLIGPTVTEENQERLRLFYKQRPLTILPNTGFVRRSNRSPAVEDVFDDDGVFLQALIGG